MPNPVCKGCGGPTGPGKAIATARGPAMVHSCLSGCVNPQKPQYALGTFGAAPAAAPAGTPVGGAQVANLLGQINIKLEAILKLMRSQLPATTSVEPDEMGPDQGLPEGVGPEGF